MSNQQLVNLRIDFAFKQLFGTSGNEDILIAFFKRNVTRFFKIANCIHICIENMKKINYRY